MSSAAAIPSVTLNDDNTMPVIGLGVGGLSDSDTEAAVLAALAAGYRLIDTAAAYGNEEAVGRAIAESGVPRDELFITTKLSIEDQGFQASQDSVKASLTRLGLDYVDLYLIEWPATELGKYVDSWGGMMKSRSVGDIRSIGLSNFHAPALDDIISLSYFTPAVNQIELHPLLNQAELRAINAEHSIITEAYCPLGAGNLLDNAAVTAIAEEHGKTSAQVLIRWSLQLGNVVIPRSSSPERIKSNLDVFGFELSDDQLSSLNGLHVGTRFHPDPETYTGS
ncbi:MAG: aldo/keto reductase [Actinomycetia bacterium]|nr:aldo/keto reductase [Actinomycetes bacterium]